jgi:hypothetical protein
MLLSIHQDCCDLRDRVRENRERDTSNQMPWRWVCVWGAMVTVVLPVAHANPRSVGDVGRAAMHDQPREACRPPPTLYIAQRQGSTVHKRTDAPDQDVREGVGRAVGLVPMEINLTLVSCCSDRNCSSAFACGGSDILTVGRC